MRRASSRISDETGLRLEQLEEQNPEWHSWLEMLRVIGDELGASVWECDLVRRDDLAAVPQSPLLRGSEVVVVGTRVERLIETLSKTAAKEAASLAGYRPNEATAIHLLEASLRQDAGGIESLARDAGVDQNALATVAQLTAITLLSAQGTRLHDRIPVDWTLGYCPVCAGWPIVAEVRGLDQTRQLRCARCGTEWRTTVMSCPFCHETDHEKLGALVKEDEPETLRVETCATCRGYLKSFPALTATPHFELLVLDVETVELDLVAIDRGFARPDAPTEHLDVRVSVSGR